MDNDINWGRIIFWAFIALVAWSIYDSVTNPPEPRPYNPNEICTYYDADPTQYTEMVEECYVP